MKYIITGLILGSILTMFAIAYISAVERDLEQDIAQQQLEQEKRFSAFYEPSELSELKVTSHPEASTMGEKLQWADGFNHVQPTNRKALQ